ncbi:MAG: dipeptidase [Pseudomonadota bacterium]
MKVFDGHNDVLTKLLDAGGVAAADGFLTSLPGHIDAAKAQVGGLAGGFFAIWPPSRMDLGGIVEQMVNPPYDLPLPSMVDQGEALNVTLAQAAILNRLEEIGALAICLTADDIDAAIAADRMAAVMHLEGADGIDPDLHALDVLYRAGLRSLGPVWSRPTIFAEGVPFTHPATPDIGGGLTEAGERLIRRYNALGVMIDLSHLNEAGFWDVARLSDAPLVATHSNAHAICPHARNLTDRQLDAIRETGGVVGLNFAVAFLREDGAMLADTPVETMIRHLDHLLEKLGEDGVALGSDFDGAVTPAAIGGAEGLPVLVDAMAAAGYGDALIAKICHRNWIDLLRRTQS